MQLEEIQIPVYFGGFIDVFWDSDGIIRVDTERDRLSICANGPALAALAKQLLYFSCNNSLRHAHVHCKKPRRDRLRWLDKMRRYLLKMKLSSFAGPK